jgi:hypothetical protein
MVQEVQTEEQKEISGLKLMQSAYSDEIVHLFRLIPTSGSEGNRPVIPKQSGQVIGAKRRWCFCYFSEFLS